MFYVISFSSYILSLAWLCAISFKLFNLSLYPFIFLVGFYLFVIFIFRKIFNLDLFLVLNFPVISPFYVYLFFNILILLFFTPTVFAESTVNIRFFNANGILEDLILTDANLSYLRSIWLQSMTDHDGNFPNLDIFMQKSGLNLNFLHAMSIEPIKSPNGLTKSSPVLTELFPKLIALSYIDLDNHVAFFPSSSITTLKVYCILHQRLTNKSVSNTEFITAWPLLYKQKQDLALGLNEKTIAALTSSSNSFIIYNDNLFFSTKRDIKLIGAYPTADFIKNYQDSATKSNDDQVLETTFFMGDMIVFDKTGSVVKLIELKSTKSLKNFDSYISSALHKYQNLNELIVYTPNKKLISDFDALQAQGAESVKLSIKNASASFLKANVKNIDNKIMNLSNLKQFPNIAQSKDELTFRIGKYLLKFSSKK